MVHDSFGEGRSDSTKPTISDGWHGMCGFRDLPDFLAAVPFAYNGLLGERPISSDRIR